MLGILGAAVGVGHQRLRRQEGRGNADGRIEQAARVVAQVEHEAIERAGLVEVVEVLHDRSTGVFLEGRNAQITVAGFDEFRLDALDLDHPRVSVISIGFVSPLRMMLSLIWVFGLPRIFLTASVNVSPSPACRRA